ncbi:MAG: tRNA 4-thiouridine(8) synthase ThiI [Candidatus Omnitrophica bacterium]|nr:tRNA 4-thiouridine(8) synthase ThiI [Candidatus Omnitrophota bacterium]
MVKAIGLFSGGLDSILACKLIMEQGIKVKGLAFLMDFASRDTDGFKERLKKTAKQINLELDIIDVSEEFLELIRNPVHGFGKNLNPCIDCKTFFLTKAKEIMDKEGYDLIFTGEVIGQRPMSQRKEALNIISNSSGLKGTLLRPLSAKILPETAAEQKGLVDRSKLLDLNGRSRKPQMALAQKYGIKIYGTPAGGCLLTDPIFAKRLLDIIEHDSLDKESIKLLKFGRHFRLDAKTKVIVGRDEKENDIIEEQVQENDLLFEGDDFSSPIGLLRGNITQENIKKAAELVVSHTRESAKEKVKVIFWPKEGFVDVLDVSAASPKERETLRI